MTPMRAFPAVPKHASRFRLGSCLPPPRHSRISTTCNIVPPLSHRLVVPPTPRMKIFPARIAASLTMFPPPRMKASFATLSPRPQTQVVFAISSAPRTKIFSARKAASFTVFPPPRTKASSATLPPRPQTQVVFATSPAPQTKIFLAWMWTSVVTLPPSQMRAPFTALQPCPQAQVVFAAAEHVSRPRLCCLLHLGNSSPSMTCNNVSVQSHHIYTDMLLPLGQQLPAATHHPCA